MSDEIRRYSVRAFRVPKLDFEATCYVDMISWEGNIFEPPLTLHMTEDELNSYIETPLEVLPYPGHTQAVERGVKLTTEASTSVIGEEKRDGMIRQKINSRTLIPKFMAKKDALPLLDL